MDILKKAQKLPEKKRKVILWLIVVIIAVILLFFWFRSLKLKFEKASDINLGDSFQGIERIIKEVEQQGE